jgi:hypothetical protein
VVVVGMAGRGRGEADSAVIAADDAWKRVERRRT